jgi:imidazolonepropionase-like amidohydrolase/Tol biopolymer transport system component
MSFYRPRHCAPSAARRAGALFLFTTLACSAHTESAYTPETPTRVSAEEGTALYFDVAPDGRSIVLDLMGQLWDVPIGGGRALALTDAVREQADDRQLAISPDGRWIAVRGDRPGGRGIWLHERGGGGRLQLTDSALILGGDEGVPTWTPDGRSLIHQRRGSIVMTEVSTHRTTSLTFDGLENRALDEPFVSADGSRLLVSGPWPSGSARSLFESARGAAIWEVDLTSGRARRLTGEGVAARAPVYDPTGRSIAWFVRDSGGVRLEVRSPDGSTRVMSRDAEIEPRRARWSADGRELYYVAAGRLRSVPATGGASRAVPFLAEISARRPSYHRSAAHIPAPGERVRARGQAGLALAPDGDRLALLALGRIWISGLDGAPRSIADVPVSAAGLHWSPDGRTLLWSDGVHGRDDLWLTDVATGRTRRLTQTADIELPIGWSPDGEYVGFLFGDRLRIASIQEGDSARDLGAVPWSETAAFGIPYAWLPRGDTLLAYGMNGWPVASRACAEAALVTTMGEWLPLREFPCRPGHAIVAADGSLITIESGLPMRHPRTEGGWGGGEPIGVVPALNPTGSRSGALLYVGPDGLHLRDPGGRDRSLGWPLEFEAPSAPPLLLRNVHVAALDVEAARASDVLISDGVIREIGAAGTLSLPAAGAGVIEDATGLWLLPGLIDTHQHFIDTDVDVVRTALRHGITTVRDMWGRVGVAATVRDAVDAGALTGARVIVSGPPFYTAPSNTPITSDFLWLAADSAAADRGLALMAGMGAGHAKLRYVQSWSAGAAFVRRAHARGLSVSGHCAHALVIILAGMDGLEHADGQCGDWEFGMRQDIALLFGSAGVATSPIIHLHERAARELKASQQSDQGESAARRAERARSNAYRLANAGARLIAGSDAQDEPGSLHEEIANLVAAGLTPRAALLAATREAAHALGIGDRLGRVRPGYIADLLLLDADPLADIRNTRRTAMVIQGGRVVHRGPAAPTAR